MSSFCTFFDQYCQQRNFSVDTSHMELVNSLDRWEKNSPKGWYIWGDVGRGKSTIARAFYEYYPNKKKQWSHFTDWMMTVQKQLALDSVTEIQKKHFFNFKFFQQSPLEVWAQTYIQKYRIIFLDELTLHHIADGIVLQKIFKFFIQKGITIIITSNTPPESLYEQGLNRERLIPLFTLLKKQLKVVNLNGKEDFRYRKKTKNFHYFLSRQKLEEFIETSIPIAQYTTFSTHFGQRLFTFDKVYQNTALCSFHELCEKDRSLQDYKVLFSTVKTLFLYDVPSFSPEKINSVQRFIVLIDFLYDHHINLSMQGLISFENIQGTLPQTISLQRTLSRLIEMLSKNDGLAV